MKFLKSYGGAMAVTVVVVILSILFGSHRSLVAQRAEVESAFFPTEESAFSISTDLEDCAAIAANILAVGERYLPAGDLAPLDGSRNMLSDWHGIGSAHTAYRRLLEEAYLVLDKLEGETLSGQDADYVKGFRADLTAREDTIARSDYNRQVDDFNAKVLGVFPANLLGRITFVSPAQAFR